MTTTAQGAEIGRLQPRSRVVLVLRGAEPALRSAWRLPGPCGHSGSEPVVDRAASSCHCRFPRNGLTNRTKQQRAPWGLAATGPGASLSLSFPPLSYMQDRAAWNCPESVGNRKEQQGPWAGARQASHSHHTGELWARTENRGWRDRALSPLLLRHSQAGRVAGGRQGLEQGHSQGCSWSPNSQSTGVWEASDRPNGRRVLRPLGMGTLYLGLPLRPRPPAPGCAAPRGCW